MLQAFKDRFRRKERKNDNADETNRRETQEQQGACAIDTVQETPEKNSVEKTTVCQEEPSVFPPMKTNESLPSKAEDGPKISQEYERHGNSSESNYMPETASEPKGGPKRPLESKDNPKPSPSNHQGERKPKSGQIPAKPKSPSKSKTKKTSDKSPLSPSKSHTKKSSPKSKARSKTSPSKSKVELKPSTKSKDNPKHSPSKSKQVSAYAAAQPKGASGVNPNDNSFKASPTKSKDPSQKTMPAESKSTSKVHPDKPQAPSTEKAHAKGKASPKKQPKASDSYSKASPIKSNELSPKKTQSKKLPEKEAKKSPEKGTKEPRKTSPRKEQPGTAKQSPSKSRSIPAGHEGASPRKAVSHEKVGASEGDRQQARLREQPATDQPSLCIRGYMPASRRSPVVMDRLCLSPFLPGSAHRPDSAKTYGSDSSLARSVSLNMYPISPSPISSLNTLVQSVSIKTISHYSGDNSSVEHVSASCDVSHASDSTDFPKLLTPKTLVSQMLDSRPATAEDEPDKADRLDRPKSNK